MSWHTGIYIRLVHSTIHHFNTSPPDYRLDSPSLRQPVTSVFFLVLGKGCRSENTRRRGCGAAETEAEAHLFSKIHAIETVIILYRPTEYGANYKVIYAEQANRANQNQTFQLIIAVQEKIDSLVELPRHSRGGNALPTCPRGSTNLIGCPLVTDAHRRD
jgi:hypothetical protein